MKQKNLLIYKGHFKNIKKRQLRRIDVVVCQDTGKIEGCATWVMLSVMYKKTAILGVFTDTVVAEICGRSIARLIELDKEQIKG